MASGWGARAKAVVMTDLPPVPESVVEYLAVVDTFDDPPATKGGRIERDLLEAAELSVFQDWMLDVLQRAGRLRPVLVSGAEFDLEYEHPYELNPPQYGNLSTACLFTIEPAEPTK